MNRNVFELRFLPGVYERKPNLRKIVPRQLVSAQVFLLNLGKLRFKNISQCFAFETRKYIFNENRSSTRQRIDTLKLANHFTIEQWE